MSLSILSLNPGHDGAIAYVRDGSLIFSLEGEEDSKRRHQRASATVLLEALQRIDAFPDIIAISGWEENEIHASIGVGYHGIRDDQTRRTKVKIAGISTEVFESTHERSHLFCSYGLSPFRQGEPCYALVWEGQTGRFYEIDECLNILEHPTVLSYPGYKYSFLYDLADATRPVGLWSLSAAGKLMALASYSRRGPWTPDEAWIIQRILTDVEPPKTDKEQFRTSPYFNCGVTDPRFLELAGKFSDALFERFLSYASANLTKGYPLLIGGGCGLNCEWNTRWKETGLFADVFVPPVTNDSGSAIGTAIEAQYYLDGCAKISWDVYRGSEFVWDIPPEYVTEDTYDYTQIARELAEGAVIAWVQGRCEIGPRALGHRSLLAAPFRTEMRDRLNAIKRREPYRPVAPVCLQEDGAELFGLEGGSPYMLHFQRVRVSGLLAITHVDGSARAQTVNAAENPELHALLTAFKALTGFGVLCNTSLNFPGRGFINRSSDLFRYVRRQKIDAAVVNGRHFRRLDGQLEISWSNGLH